MGSFISYRLIRTGDSEDIRSDNSSMAQPASHRTAGGERRMEDMEKILAPPLLLLVDHSFIHRVLSDFDFVSVGRIDVGYGPV